MKKIKQWLTTWLLGDTLGRLERTERVASGAAHNLRLTQTAFSDILEKIQRKYPINDKGAVLVYRPREDKT